MNSDIERKLVAASFKDNGRDTFVALMAQVPFNKENFNEVLGCAMQRPAVMWVVDYYTPQMLEILSTPDGWDEWSAEYPVIDELLLGATSDPRWMDVLAFRWLSPDGRPEGGERGVLRSTEEKQTLFAESWNAAISNHNLARLEQMLNHPTWKQSLTETDLRLAVWAPLAVWKLFHNHNIALPLRTFWQAAMASTGTDDKLHFLLNDVGSSAEFIAQQYTYSWCLLSLDITQTLHQIVGGVRLAPKMLSTMHERIVERCFVRRGSSFVNKDANEIIDVLRNVPLFEPERFIDALAHDKFTQPKEQLDLSEPMTMAVDTLIQQLDGTVQQRVADDYAAHAVLGQLPSIQKLRIASEVETLGAQSRVKKL